MYADAKTTSVMMQLNALKRAGFTGPGGGMLQKKDVFIDENESRFQRDVLTDKSNLPVAGSTVRLACAAYIGKPGRDRASAVRALARKGVLVAVLDGEPVLYDTDAKVAKFLKEAEAVARSDNGKRSGGAGPGRPPTGANISPEQWADLLVLWRKHDEADPEYVTRPAFRAIVAMHSTNNGKKMDGKDVTNDWLTYHFGGRKDRNERKPRPGLWKET